MIPRRAALFAMLCAAAPLAAQPKLAPVTEATYASVLKSAAGNVTLVNFWATWCVPCRKEMPLLAQMKGRLAPKGLRLITVSADDPSEEKAAIEFLAKSGLNADGAYLRTAKNEDAFLRAVEPKWNGALPALFLYDRKGKLVKSYFGETPLAAVEAEIKKLL